MDRMPPEPDPLPPAEPTEPLVDSSVSGLETRLEKPRRAERTAVADSIDVAVDDLPAAPVGRTPRDAQRELREVVDLLRSRLRAVEAQVVSLARELAASPRSADDEDRARALVTSSIEEARAGLRVIDRCELRFGIERGSRPATPIPTS